MPTTAKKKRNRRTADQIVADLETKIEEVKARAAAREARQDPARKALLTVAKSIDKALHVATDHGDGQVVAALEASRAPLSTALVEMGVRLPAAKAGVRGRKAKAGAAS